MSRTSIDQSLTVPLKLSFNNNWTIQA